MTVLLIATALILVTVVLEVIGRRPAVYRRLDTSRVRSLVWTLYWHGREGAALNIACGANRVIVRKVIRAPDDVVLVVDDVLDSVKESGGAAVGIRVDQRNRSVETVSEVIAIVEAHLDRLAGPSGRRKCSGRLTDTHLGFFPGFTKKPEDPRYR